MRGKIGDLVLMLKKIKSQIRFGPLQDQQRRGEKVKMAPHKGRCPIRFGNKTPSNKAKLLTTMAPPNQSRFQMPFTLHIAIVGKSLKLFQS